MVIMDAYYSSDRLLEMWQKIDHLHLSYLEMEESPEKIDHRIKLEDCIRDYLCTAYHSQKFCFRETAEVLYRSASSKKDFSGYKAATGWNAIQLYAGNLLSQPWRKEYREVKTYCGFYKHQIEANLVGAEVMFEAMGYKHTGDGVLVLEGPICPDQVTSVSKDSLIAYVECQIIKAIWEEISPQFNISWLEVLEFRKAHLCNPELAIKAITYQYHQKQYQEHARSYSQGADTFGNGGRNLHTVPSPVLQSNHSFPPLSGHGHVPIPPAPLPPQHIYGANGCCPNNYSGYAHVPAHTYAYPVPLPYHQPVMKAPYTNGYYMNGYVSQPHPLYGYTVPTGQLIEVDSHNGGYDVVDRPNHARINRSPPPNHPTKKVAESKVPSAIRDPEKEETQFEDWDYVYRNLESQGYSKDLGERGDILSPATVDKRKRSKPTNLDEAMNSMTVTERPLKISEALEKFDKDKRKNPEAKPQERRHSQGSSYENLSEPKKSNVVSKAKTKTLPPKEKNPPNVAPPRDAKTLDARKSKENKWECKACTFLNDNSKDICEMCSKTKTNVEQHMEIGGAECSKCTLVNPKEVSICQVCGASLKNSPTYI